MRISTKMTIMLSTTGFVLFGAYAIYLVVNEEKDLRKVAEREINLLGRSLQVAIENALRDHQIEDIQETVTRLDQVEPTVDIVVYGTDGKVIAESPGSEATQSLEGRLAEKAVAAKNAVLEFKLSGDPWRGAVAYPLNDDDGTLLGSLAVARPLVDMQADLAATKEGVILSVVLFVLAASVLGLVLGRTYIAKPLNGLIQAMRQVRVGDLQSPVLAHHRDEIGEVATEFNVMVSELSKARETLEKEQADRRRIELALRQADKLVTIGQLAAALAHEIGSPLQVLNGRARALLEHDYDRERVRRHAEAISSQGERIAAIVEQLLGYARRRPPKTVETDLGQLARSVTDLLDIEARQAGVKVELIIPPDHPVVPCEPSGIQQVIFNLLRNALAATASGGRVEIRVGRGSFSPVEGGAESPAVFLEVSDTGCGISEENLPRIFDPFFTTRADEGGTGLGLAVVKSIVDEHRGKVSVESRDGTGSRFRVDLPLAAKPEAAEEKLT